MSKSGFRITYVNDILAFNILINFSIGKNANNTKQINSSPPTANPFTVREYTIGDIPAGA